MAAAAVEATYQVLEFVIGEDRYCVDLDLVDEIVDKGEDITTIPQSGHDVKGVMDLRGETTTIVDPRISLGIDSDRETKYVIVFESESKPVGWLIEDVTKVARMPEKSLDDSVENDAVKGVFKTEEAFTVWLSPERATQAMA